VLYVLVYLKHCLLYEDSSVITSDAITWEASLVLVLLKIKGLAKMNRSDDYFLPCCLWSYYICTECSENATLLIFCILYTLYHYLVDYLKKKAIKNWTHSCYR